MQDYLKAARRLGREAWRMAFPLPCPNSVIWFLTELCNLNCQHCFVHNAQRKARAATITTEEGLRILDSAGLESVTFTGGEPTLSSSFKMLVHRAAVLRSTRQLGITSNGMNPGAVLDALTTVARPDLQLHLVTSLDGPERVHNAIRGSELAFKRVTAMIRDVVLLREAGMRLTVRAVMTVQPDNFDRIVETCAMARDMGALFSMIPVRGSSQVQGVGERSTFQPAGRYDLTVDQLREMRAIGCDMMRKWMSPIDVQQDLLRLDEEIYFREHGCWRFPCMAGRDDAVILPDGSVSVCEMLEPFANLRDYEWDWRALWAAHQDKRGAKKCACQWDCQLGSSPPKSLQGWWRILATEVSSW